LRRLAADEELIVGAGTVIRAEQVDLAVEAGARFVVTPGLSGEVMRRCREVAMPVIPVYRRRPKSSRRWITAAA